MGLLVIFILFLALLICAPEQVMQILLAGVWALMILSTLLACAWYIIKAML